MLIKAVIETGAFFGEIALLFNMSRTASVCAVDYSDLASLSREKFEDMIQLFPEFEASFSAAYNDFILSPQQRKRARQLAKGASAESGSADSGSSEGMDESSDDSDDSDGEADHSNDEGSDEGGSSDAGMELDEEMGPGASTEDSVATRAKQDLMELLLPLTMEAISGPPEQR